MKKFFTIILILSAFFSNAQRTMFGDQNNYVAPLVPPNITTSGLILYLDASNPLSYSGTATGTTWTDLSGNNNNVTFVNTTAFSSANQGSIIFSGANYGVINSPTSNLIFGNSNFTISLWQLASASNNNTRLFGNLSNNSWTTNNWVFAQNNSANKVDFFVNNSTTNPIVGVTTTAQTWQNIVMTRSGNTWTIYLNNNQVATTTNTASVDGGILRSFYIASSGWPADVAPKWIGSIANILIYNKALTTLEISSNYNALKTRFGL